MKDNKSLYEKYVVSIDLAKRLAACGFNYPTLFYWINNPQLDMLTLNRSDTEYLGPTEFKFAAPTAAELREHLPLEVWIQLKSKSLIRRPGTFHYLQKQGQHSVSLVIKSPDTQQVYETHREESSSEADAVGLMYCHIFENHLHELHT